MLNIYRHKTKFNWLRFLGICTHNQAEVININFSTKMITYKCLKCGKMFKRKDIL